MFRSHKEVLWVEISDVVLALALTGAVRTLDRPSALFRFDGRQTLLACMLLDLTNTRK